MIIVVDTGATKTFVTSFTAKGKIGTVHRFLTPKNTATYTTQLREILQQHYQAADVDALVVAVPGTIKNGIAQWCPNLGWKNFHLAKGLAGIFGDTPIYIENDANLAGLGETRLLKPLPLSSLYVTISTGIGTGFVTNGHINPGLANSEGGHILVEYDGLVREWESFASGRAIYRTYGKYARDITNTRQWQHIADRISRGFLTVIPLTQPDIIIIGGSIGTYFERYGAQLQRLLDARLPEHITRPRIIQARHPEHAVVYGGYYYALDQLASTTASS
jgi:predicted NBD/HSP70 family sugar kinase